MTHPERIWATESGRWSRETSWDEAIGAVEYVRADTIADAATVADYDAARASHLEHVHDLDVALNGDGAAKRPLLIDIKQQLLDLIAASKADTIAPGVTVRPIEWQPYGGIRWKADTPVGKYIINPRTGIGDLYVAFNGQPLVGTYRHADAAKAAAQADYEHRILATLTPKEPT